jgi:hypothetical protein
MTIVEYAELPRELSSDYLAKYQEVEGLRIHTVRMDLEARTAEALLDVRNPISPESFHLSQNVAYLALCQLIMAYTCKELEADKNTVGQYTQFEQVSHNLRGIKGSEGIRLKVQFEDEEKTEVDDKTRVKSNWSYEVEGGKFSGHFRFVYFEP